MYEITSSAQSDITKVENEHEWEWNFICNDNFVGRPNDSDLHVS